MAYETEIKLRVTNVEELRATLKRMGARTVHRGNGRVHEWNTLFDTARQDLRKRRQLLRIRIETPAGRVPHHRKNAGRAALLTFKGPVAAGHSANGNSVRRARHKIREEIEFQIADAAKLAEILTALGMHASFHYEKYRTTFELPESKSWAKGLKIEVDETPIGTFMELEGPPRALDRAARELGFSKADYILTNYMRLNEQDCRRRGVKACDMVFRERR
jgi:adenylate cyclase, class 2